MASLDEVEFPADRSIVGDEPAWTFVEAEVARPAAGQGADPAMALGCAVLFIFSRLSDHTCLGLRFDRGDKSGASHDLVADFPHGATLAEAFATLGEARHGTAECTRVAMELATVHRHLPDAGKTPVLSFAPSADLLRLRLDYDASRMSQRSARDVLEKVELVLRALDTTPDMPCADLVLIGPLAGSLIPDMSQTIAKQVFDSVPKTFFEVAARHGARPAVSNGTQVYSYDDLSGAVRALAGQLKSAGLCPGDVVAVAGLSSFGMLASMLAVLTAGGVLVTMDGALPEARLALIADVSHPRFHIQVGPESGMAGTAGKIPVVDWPARAALKRLTDGAPPVDSVLAPPDSDASAYIFFTSGSTGAPKGVLGTHLGLAHFLSWQRSSFPIGPEDRAAQLTALSFDVVLRDVLFPLTSGACVHIPTRELLLDARRMLAWIEDTEITTMHVVPSLMRAWLQAHDGGRPFASLRYIFFAGEPLTEALLKRLERASSAKTSIVNLYGPTETTLAKLCNRIESIEPGVQPIGRPMPGTDVVILRQRRSLCGLWEVGEIAIRTPYRSKGYFENPALTQGVFVPNPLRDDPDDLVYLTGDIGRFRPDGKVEIFGRNDAQIKIRGVRIEPNEIEGILLKQPGIKDAAVTVRIGANDSKTLFALVVPETPVPPDGLTSFNQHLRQALRVELHEAMVPSRILAAERLPYLPNGKLDRKAIGALKLEVPAAESREAGEDVEGDDMRALARELETLLNAPIDLQKTFIEMGGDSLSYIEASILVENALGWLPPNWDSLTFAELFTMKRDTRARTTTVRSVVALRAVAISMVVFSHFEVFNLPGSTDALFAVSGWSFGRYTLSSIARSKSVRPVFDLIFKIALPVLVFSMAVHILHPPIRWPTILMVDNFIDPHYDGNRGLWFLDVLLQLMLAMAVIFSSRTLVRLATENIVRFSMAAAVISLCVSSLIYGYWNTDYLMNRVPQMAAWLFFIGMAVSGAERLGQKAAIAAFALAAAALHHFTSWAPIEISTFSAICIALIAFVPEIRIPSVLGVLVRNIAGASLFIYIYHFSFRTQLLKLGLGSHEAVIALIAIGGGVLIWRVWDYLYGLTASRIRALWNKLSPKAG